MAEMTERQAADWPRAVAEAQRHVDTSHIPERIEHHEWTVRWDEETRPGRGSYLRAVWLDGEHVVSIFMDVYGNPSVAVASTDWVHNSSDEECGCSPCEVERAADLAPSSPNSGEGER